MKLKVRAAFVNVLSMYVALFLFVCLFVLNLGLFCLFVVVVPRFVFNRPLVQLSLKPLFMCSCCLLSVSVFCVSVLCVSVSL